MTTTGTPAPASTGPTGAAPADAPAGAEVRLVGLHRRYGQVRALDGLDLTVPAGRFVALLGPSGCGKTTALRVLAGLEDADAGQVLVGGRDVGALPANRRGMGLVFQAYSLFPHLTARDNVEFGLRLRRAGAAARRARAAEVLELVGLAAQAHRYPHELSGGQQQRVALARALAVRPSVLLLDEPLSALDAQVRVQLRDEIRRVQLEVGTTTLMVTHDQEEALAVADLVGVMRDGRLEQIGTPHEVYSTPATAFVAGFVGLTNRLPAVVHGERATVLGAPLPLVDPTVPPGPGTALVRPEQLLLHPPLAPHGTTADAADATAGLTHRADGTAPAATVTAVTFLGAVSRVTVRLDDGTPVVVQVPGGRGQVPAPGDTCRVGVGTAPVLVVADDPRGRP